MCSNWLRRRQLGPVAAGNERGALGVPDPRPFRVTIVGRVHMLAANRIKWSQLPDHVRAAFITPRRVRRTLGIYEAEFDDSHEHVVLPALMADRMSGLCFSPLALARTLWRQRPDLVHVDEEPSTLAMLQILILKPLLGYKVVFFTWENLATHLPAPLALVRRLALRWADGAVAGNREAAQRLRGLGLECPVALIPQLGVDPDLFSSQEEDRRAMRAELGLTSFTVGYVGRLVVAKGLEVLLDALAELPQPWQLLCVGRGADAQALADRAQALGLGERIQWIDTVPHADIPGYLRAIDALVLPSLTTERWKEQFGHILIEAMACETPVVGSNSGAIPEVVGDAGWVVPEGDAGALAKALAVLQADPVGAHAWGYRGRQRVLAQYTNRRVVEQLVAFWRELMLREA